MGRTREHGCGFQPYKHTQHLKKKNTALTELNYCLDQSGLPRKQDIPVHTHSHGEWGRTSSTEEEGAREPSSGHSAAGCGPFSMTFKLALPLGGDIQDRQPGPYSITG